MRGKIALQPVPVPLLPALSASWAFLALRPVSITKQFFAADTMGSRSDGMMFHAA
jgi:hypothetical protein